MAAGMARTFLPYQVWTPVADTSVAVTFDLLRRRLVLIVPITGGATRRRFVAAVI